MVSFDFNKSMRQVSELRQIADELMNVYNQKYDVAISNVKSSWKGETGQLFHNKCITVGERVKNEAAKIRAYANNIESVARATQQADIESAAKIAKR